MSFANVINAGRVRITIDTTQDVLGGIDGSTVTSPNNRAHFEIRDIPTDKVLEVLTALSPFLPELEGFLEQAATVGVRVPRLNPFRGPQEELFKPTAGPPPKSMTEKLREQIDSYTDEKFGGPTWLGVRSRDFLGEPPLKGETAVEVREAEARSIQEQVIMQQKLARRMRADLKQIAKELGTDFARDMLYSEIGVSRVSRVPPEKYLDVIRACENMLGEPIKDPGPPSEPLPPNVPAKQNQRTFRELDFDD